MTDNLPIEADESDSGEPEIVDRDNLGKFVKGVSGNPAGRPKGSRNRATLIREALQERTVRRVTDDIEEILDTAIKLAKSGDRQMIRMFVKDVIQRRDDDDEDEGKSPSRVTINVKNLTVAPQEGASSAKAVLDGEYTSESE